MGKIRGITDIGYWSELKLIIVKDYAAAYSAILAKQQYLKHVYIDAFAGAGAHISRESKGPVPGSPLNALYVEPPFSELHLIDLDGEKIELLRDLTCNHPEVTVYHGDANRILLDDVFPKVQFNDYRRGLCLLDPYGLHLNWEVIKTAAAMKSIEIFLNFPIMDMNRNVLSKRFEIADQIESGRMTAFWGDESWKQAAYSESPQQGLFGDLEMQKETNSVIAERFRARLETEAGFSCVPEPIPMRNKTGAIIYYLFFASHSPVGMKIAKHIFNKYKDQGIQ